VRVDSASLLARAVLAVFVLEVAYAISTRQILPRYFSGDSLELAITVVRVFAAAACWLLFGAIIKSRDKAAPPPNPIFLIASLFTLFAAAFLMANLGLTSTTSKILFAAASLPVALHEELVYRGVFQNLFESRLGVLGAIIASNALFVIYHIGAQPMAATVVLEIFLVGAAYALIYVATGSLATTVVVHFVYDAIYAFSPLLSQPLSRWFGLLFISAAVLLASMARTAKPSVSAS